MKAVRAAQTAAASADPPAPAATPTPKLADPPAAAAPVSTVDSELTTRIKALEEELNGAKAKLTEREKMRTAPADVEGLLDLMAELGDAATMEKLSEAYLARQDNPAHKVLTAAEKRLAAIEAKIAEGEKAEKERAERAAQQAAAAEGEKVARGIISEGKARWPRITRDDRNIAEAMNDAATRALKKAGDKQLTQAQRMDAFRDALDEVEKDLADRHARYAMPDIPRKPTISSATGSTGTVPQPRTEKPLTRAEMKAQILARVRAGQPSTT